MKNIEFKNATVRIKKGMAANDFDLILFRFVPTMKCNYSCSYCFLSKQEKEIKEQMFDYHSSEEWIEGMKKWENNQVEFYMWGGEPFIIPDIYKVLSGWLSLPFVQNGNRIDTNTAFAESILKEIPNNLLEKLSLNCSWHPESEELPSFMSKIKQLKQQDAVGMVNFVASKLNLETLTQKYHISVPQLVKQFEEIGIFLNVAADFHMINGLTGIEYDAYKDFILNFQCPEDWKQLRCEKEPCNCFADIHYFTVDNKGDIYTCHNEKVGNFFTGYLVKSDKPKMCNNSCPSLVSYCFREDNNFSFKAHLPEYVKRNQAYRKQKRDPKISIILPAYNHGKLIRKSVNTILNQFFTDFELIIVNDGSTDETAEYLKTLTDERIKIITNETNKGLPASLNIGMKEAKGIFVTWTSADNYHSRSWLNKLFEALLKDKEASMVYSSFAWVNDNEEIIRIVENQGLSYDVLMQKSPGNASFLYKRKIHDEIGYYDETMEGAEDFDFWLRLIAKYKVIYIPDILYYYRFHNNSMTFQKMDLVKRSTAKARRKARQRQGFLSIVFVANGTGGAGTELYNMSIAKEFQKGGHDVFIIVPEIAEVTGKVQEMVFGNIKLFKINVSFEDWQTNVYNEEVAKPFKKIIEGINPDLIHINHFMGLTSAIMEGLDIPYVVTLHDAFTVCQQAHLLRDGQECEGQNISKCVSCFLRRNMNAVADDMLYFQLLQRMNKYKEILEKAYAVIAPTDFIGNKVKELSDKINIVKRPLGLLPFFVKKKTPEDFKGPINLVYMGNICVTKGLAELVRAFSGADFQNEEVRLYIYGQIEDTAYFQAIMEQVKMDKVIEYRGPYGRENIHKILEFAHCVIVPSQMENYSTVIREAFHAGVPVMCKDVGGNSEIVESAETGLIYEKFDNLKGGLKMVCQELLMALSKKIEEPMTINQDARELIEIYKEAIGGV